MISFNFVSFWDLAFPSLLIYWRGHLPPKEVSMDKLKAAFIKHYYTNSQNLGFVFLMPAISNYSNRQKYSEYIKNSPHLQHLQDWIPYQVRLNANVDLSASHAQFVHLLNYTRIYWPPYTILHRLILMLTIKHRSFVMAYKLPPLNISEAYFNNLH